MILALRCPSEPPSAAPSAPLSSGDFDVLVCGASFAGLDRRPRAARDRRARARARPLRDRRAADVRVRRADRVAAQPGPRARRSARRSARCSSTRRGRPRAGRCRGRSRRSTTGRCATLLWEQRGAGTEFETAKVDGRHGARRRRRSCVHTDRGDVSAPLVVDALGWKRTSAAALVQPPNARLSRGLEVHPGRHRRGPRAVDRQARHPRGLRLVVPGRATSCASASARSTRTTTSRQPTVALADDLGLPPDGYQGNWIPHRLRPAVEDGVFFAGDSAGHCLPVTAEGIRTAFYFGDRVRARAAGRARGPARRGTRRCARYGAFSARTAGSTSACCRCSTRCRSCGRGC